MPFKFILIRAAYCFIAHRNFYFFYFLFYLIFFEVYELSTQHLSAQPSGIFQKPQVDPEHQVVYEDSPAMLRCWVPSNPNARLKWFRADGTSLPNGAFDDGAGILYYIRARLSDADFYVCLSVSHTGSPLLESDPVELKVIPHERKKETTKCNFLHRFRFCFLFL